MKGVIVFDPIKGYSFKTPIKCYWCYGEWFSSIDEIKNQFPDINFHDEVLPLNPAPYFEIAKILATKDAK